MSRDIRGKGRGDVQGERIEKGSVHMEKRCSKGKGGEM